MENEEKVVLTQEDFSKSRPLALAGFVIGQSISKTEYEEYMSKVEGTEPLEDITPASGTEAPEEEGSRAEDGQ